MVDITLLYFLLPNKIPLKYNTIIQNIYNPIL